MAFAQRAAGILIKTVYTGLLAVYALIAAILFLWGGVSASAGIKEWHDGRYLAWRFDEEIRANLSFDLPQTMQFHAKRHQPSLINDVVYVFYSEFPRGFQGMDQCGRGGFGPVMERSRNMRICEMTIAGDDGLIIHYSLMPERITVHLAKRGQGG